jgi:hypothetical protein
MYVITLPIIFEFSSVELWLVMYCVLYFTLQIEPEKEKGATGGAKKPWNELKNNRKRTVTSDICASLDRVAADRGVLPEQIAANLIYRFVCYH